MKHLNKKACSHCGYMYALLTPARWWYRLKCCRVYIHLCACCGCTSDQLKARITGVGSSVINRITSECHPATDNVNWIRTQCCRTRYIAVNYNMHSKIIHICNKMEPIASFGSFYTIFSICTGRSAVKHLTRRHVVTVATSMHYSRLQDGGAV